MGQPSAGWARDAVRPVRFCTAPNGTRIAYAATGTGPPLLVPAAWISHLELLRQDRAYRDFFLPLAAARTVDAASETRFWRASNCAARSISPPSQRAIPGASPYDTVGCRITRCE